MTSKNEQTAPSKDNEELLKSYRHLNSCITFTTVKDGSAGSKSPASSSESESEEEEDLSIPSALRGLSIGGAKGASLSALLSQAKEKKAPDTASSIASNLSALRGISIKGLNISSSPSTPPVNTKPSLLSSIPALKGVTIQGVNSKDDSDSGSEEEPSRNNESVTFKSFRGIYIGKASDDKQKVSAHSSSSNSPEPDRDSPSPERDVPSALRGISIKGSSGNLDLSKLLKKSADHKEERNSSVLNDFSKKGLSISFSTSAKEDRRPSPSADDGNSSSNRNEKVPQTKVSSQQNLISATENSTRFAVPSSPANSKPNSAKEVPPTSRSNHPAGNSNTLNTPSNTRPSAPDNNKFAIPFNKPAPASLKHRTHVLPFNKPATESPKPRTPVLPFNKPATESPRTPVLPFNKPATESPRTPVLPLNKPATESPKPKTPVPVSQPLNCPTCHLPCATRDSLIHHVRLCKPSGSGVARKKTNAKRNSEHFARKKTNSRPLTLTRRVKGGCLACGIDRFKSFLAYEEHHAAHAHDRQLAVRLERHSLQKNKTLVEGDSDASSVQSEDLSESSNKSLKVTFKFTKGPRGRKRKTVEIVNSQQDMNVDPEQQMTNQQEAIEEQSTQIEEQPPNQIEEGEYQHEQPTNQTEEEENYTQNLSNQEDPSATQASESYQTESSSSVTTDESSPANSFVGFENFSPQDEQNPDQVRPPSTYQPQFESFPGDWFNDYDSGPRIAVAMTGASGEERDPSGGEAPTSQSQYNKEMTSEEQGGLFSQAVLGGEQQQHQQQQPAPSSHHQQDNQGSFEQLCLNDSFGSNQQQQQQQQVDNMNHNSYQDQQQQPEQQQQYPPHQGGDNDLLSELAYLNQPAPPIDQSRTSPLNQNYSPHSSNSGTPNSVGGHPTPPPSDTSFRALATSPTSAGGHISPHQQQNTTPPNASSPLQQMTQMSSMDPPVTPRLTIANNLMAATASLPSYDQTWSAPAPPQNSFNQGGFSQPNSQFGQNSNNSFVQPNPPPPQPPGPIQQPPNVRTYAPLPPGYRNSPMPRVRGRPPLGIGMPPVIRPNIIRGPGRPPGPPMMTGGRMRGYSRGGMMVGQKRPGPASMTQSPSKMRKEDINVPSRQKDTECQIIAVNNRNDGMPVIANVQGGSNRQAAPSAPDPTIHLSDSITLSVRPNGGGKDSPSKGGKEGDVVANLLASRGITVTPAEKEREEQRRLPTASDLNLSSAISVHPPTARDRDGFAVPQPPAAPKSAPTVNPQVERPIRPPTVDLTAELPPPGMQKAQCPQCPRTFPTQSLLADHAKVHQQQSQSRMPYKCHLCSAGFSSQKGQQNHYQQFHQLHLSAGDLAIPVVDFRNPVNVQRMVRLGITSFLPLSNLQNRGAAGVVGVPILTLENLHKGQVNMQQWGITDVLTLGPPKTLNTPRLRGGPPPPLRQPGPPRPS